jgi:hypothetical protein
MQLTLSQLSMIHFVGVKQSWSNQRLIPTTICAMLTLIHFHTVLWFSPTSYPLLNYVSCIFDSMLLLVVLVAFSLNILTQLLLEGSVTRLFVGHAASLMPKWDEDFSSVLLRLGIASLEATSVAGLGNEVSGIPLAEHSEAVKYQVQYGEVEMNRAGVSSIRHATEGHEGHRTRMEGFSNEIKRVRAGPSSQSDPLLLDTTWFTECKRFGYAVARFGLGCGRMIGRILRGQPVFLQPPALSSGQNQRLGVQSASASQENETENITSAQQDIYERFLSGEVLSDDDEEFSPSNNIVSQHDDDNDGTGSDTPDGEVDTLALYSDISANASSPAAASLLLAHMTDTSASPLTRRRYRNLVSGRPDVAGHEKSEWEAFIDGKSSQMSRQGPSHESRRNCVICTVEERQIICWPCR